MSTRTTLVLLAFLILIAAVVYLIEFRKPAGETATPASSDTPSLLNTSAPAINSITVRDIVSGTQVSAMRDISGTWWLTDPPNQPGDLAAWNTMASRLSYIYVRRVFTPTSDLSEYGLSTPKMSVEISTTSGLQSFVVGDATPNGASFYAHKPDDVRVYLIDGSLVNDLKQLASKPPVAAPPTLAPSALPSPAAP